MSNISLIKTFRPAFCFVCFAFLFGAFRNTPEKSKHHVIEKYVWKGKCESSGPCSVTKMILYIYSDSTFALDPHECGPIPINKTQKGWRQRKKWRIYGSWTIINGERKYLQGSIEMPMKQGNGFVKYQEIILTKK